MEAGVKIENGHLTLTTPLMGWFVILELGYYIVRKI